MDPEPAVLSAETTFANGVRQLLARRVLAMPVVDEERRYLGMFRKNHVISSVLPQVAVHEDKFSQVTRMIDAGLLRDTLHDVCQRSAEIADEPVSKHVSQETPVLRPEQPLVNALYHLYRGRNFLPVVDPASHRLCGVISTWDVLETVMEKV